MIRAQPATQQGFLLITVVLILGVLAAMALMLSGSTSLDNALVAKHAESATLDYLAESGMAHSQWQLTQNDSCLGYTDLPNTVFGEHSYSGTVSPTAGSPVSVTAVGTLADGSVRRLTYDEVMTFQPRNLTTLNVTGDTYLYKWKSDWNYGASSELWVSNVWADSLAYSFLHFDLSSVPAESRILTATLQLRQNAPSSKGGTVSVRSVSNDWMEGGQSGGNGVPNWNDRSAGNAWLTPGGDFDPVPITTTILPAGITGVFEWDITPLVAYWVSGTKSNQGLALLPESPNTDVKFDSSEVTDPANVPMLNITYACECGVVCSASESTLPIAHWKLDDAVGLVAADAEGGHDGNLVNEPIWVFSGHVGGALSFDGIDDYVSVPHDDTLSMTSAFTISAWIRNDSASVANSYRIISKESTGANDNFWLSLQSQAWWFGVGGSFFSPPITVESDRWYHLAASFDDAADQVVMYVDGAEVLSQATSTTITPNTAPVVIGSNWEGYKVWDGLLDDVRIYNRALDASEVLVVSEIVSGGGPVCAADFVADTNERQFSTSSLDISDPWGIAFLPPGSVFDGVAAPADGAWLVVDRSNRTFSMTDMDGALLARTSISVGEPRGVAYVSSGGWDNHLALANPADMRVYFLDMNGSTQGSFSTASFTEHPVGVTAIENSASGTFDGHIAISSDKDGGGGSNAGVYIVNQSGVLQVSIDISGFAAEPWGIAHVPGEDKFLVVDKAGTVFIIGFDGQLLDQYETASFGATQPQSIAINSLTSSHLVLDEDTGEAVSLTSSSCVGGGSCSAILADDFESGDYTGSTGTVGWTTPWEEFNDTGGSSSGDERVQTDSLDVVLRVRDNDGGGEGVEREADLSGYNGASLSFAYRRQGLDNSADYVAVEISSNGGSSWTELDRFAGEGTDADYQSTSYNISAYISSNTRIRFITSSDLGATDAVYFDNVEICLSN